MTRYLIHWFPFCSGGLCDRILGLASSICIANLLNMHLLIKWDHADLSDAFTLNNDYNWYLNSVGYKYLELNNHQLIDYFKTANILEDWSEENIMLWSNINVFHYMRENSFVKHLFKNDPVQQLSNAINKILKEIFIISPEILQHIPIYDIGIHIRTGDKQIYNKENEEFYRDYINETFLKIKNNMIETEIDKTIFISSDCLLTFEIAKDFFKDFNYNKGCIIHTSEEKDKINKEGLHKVFKDLLTLCNCKSSLYIGWHSNFSRIASLYDTNRKFISYEYENKMDQIQDCSPETLFSYFSWGKYT
jgi:hypothetical protein